MLKVVVTALRKDELFDFAKSAAKMSVAFDMTADEAGASMMKWRTTMNLSQDQAVALANVVNHVGDNMATTAKDITEVLVRQGAVITSSGLDQVQAAGLSAAVLFRFCQYRNCSHGNQKLIVKPNGR